MRFIRHAFFIFFLLSSGYISGQPLQLFFQNFTEKDGLSDNNIYNLYQDSRGYLWICTAEGLNRFDGYTFKKFYSGNNKSTSLPTNIIIQVLEYKHDYLLVATSNGLTRLNMLTNTFEPISDSTVCSRPTSLIVKDRNDQIILGYLDGFAFLDSSLRIKEFIKTPWPIFQIHILPSGDLLIATNRGYYIYHKAAKELVWFNDEFKNPDFPKSPIFSYYDTVENMLYTSEWDGGLFIIDIQDKKIDHYCNSPQCKNHIPTNSIYSAYKEKDRLWVGTSDGILLIDKQKGSINSIAPDPDEDHSLISGYVMKIFEDRNRNLWFGTFAGISKLNPGTQSIQQYKNELLVDGKSAEINGITRAADNTLYISTYGNGILKIREDTRQIENIGKEVMPFNWSVTADADSIIANGHDAKNYSYHPVSGKITRLDFLAPFYGKSNLLLFSFTHSSGDKWYSLNEGSGLVRYIPPQKKYIQFTNKDLPKPFAPGYFSIVAEDKSKNIWFAMNRSSNLVCWQYKTGGFKTVTFGDFPGMSRSNFAGINDMIISGEKIWVATAGTGLLMYEPEKNKLTSFTINEGLAGDVVNSLVVDNVGRLWAATTKGLSCLLPGKSLFSSFTASDGLPQTNFNERTRYYDTIKNKLYLGAKDNLVIIDPSGLLNNKDVNIQAHLDGIKVNGRNLRYDERQQNILKYDENNLQFNFSVVDLNSSSGINLWYRLEGADRNWINSEGQRTASYINLPAGNYKLNIKIFKPGTDFISTTVPFAFTIEQAWWKSALFYILLSLSAIFIVYLIIRMYYRRKLEHQQLLFEKKQAVEQERTRIATDMHDDLGAGLTGIKFLTENIAEENVSSVVNERLEKLKGYANKLIESMGEIIWAMNEKNNSIEDLLFHLRSYSVLYCEENYIECVFTLPENLEKTIITGHMRRNIFLIVKECLHNIVKHARATKVDITVSAGKYLVFGIHDNGVGFNPAEAASGNGLINMQKRAKEMYGSFNIINNNGTVIQLKIPLRDRVK